MCLIQITCTFLCFCLLQEANKQNGFKKTAFIKFRGLVQQVRPMQPNKNMYTDFVLVIDGVEYFFKNRAKFDQTAGPKISLILQQKLVFVSPKK